MSLKVPIFKFLSKAQGEQLATVFNVITRNAEEPILQYGEIVPGIFIIVGGTVDVFTEGFRTFLSRLDYGNTIGEMSLLESLTASASVRAAEDNTELLLCKSSDFRELLQSDPELAANFYKGAAVVLSSRLRTTNQRIQQELLKTKEVIQNFVQDDCVITKVNNTKTRFMPRETNTVGRLAELLPTLNKLKTEYPEKSEIFSGAVDLISEVIQEESKNFERINQKVEHIQKSLVNIDGAFQG